MNLLNALIPALPRIQVQEPVESDDDEDNGVEEIDAIPAEYDEQHTANASNTANMTNQTDNIDEDNNELVELNDDINLQHATDDQLNCKYTSINTISTRNTFIRAEYNKFKSYTNYPIPGIPVNALLPVQKHCISGNSADEYMYADEPSVLESEVSNFYSSI